MTDEIDITTPEGRAELRRLESEATPGPWEAEDDGDYSKVWSSGLLMANRVLNVEDAAFIARARTAVPALLDEIDKAEADLAETVSAVDDLGAQLLAATARVARLREALETFRDYGCPVCHGDCASANPPVFACPMQAAAMALATPAAPKDQI